MNTVRLPIPVSVSVQSSTYPYLYLYLDLNSDLVYLKCKTLGKKPKRQKCKRCQYGVWSGTLTVPQPQLCYSSSNLVLNIKPACIVIFIGTCVQYLLKCKQINRIIETTANTKDAVKSATHRLMNMMKAETFCLCGFFVAYRVIPFPMHNKSPPNAL